MDSLTETKRLITRAGHLLNAGEPERALGVMFMALGATTDHGVKTEAAYYLPRIRHGFALIYAAMGEDKRAKRNFELALKGFELDNRIGRARVMRDYGWFQFTRGYEVAGGRLLNRALDSLTAEHVHDERWEREMAATQGFLARTTAAIDPSEALDEFIRVDEVLRGGDKWIYELDNLQHLIRLLPLQKRLSYQLRAVVIWERIHVSEELKLLKGDFIDGNPIDGLTRIAWRTARRHFPL